MPKIEVNERDFFQLLGREHDEEGLIRLLSAAKAELDEWVPEEHLLKIELNDTNRPDLWSTRGLSRQLKIYLGEEPPRYPFFSSPGRSIETGQRVVDVEAGLKEIRPYIAAFVAEGPPITEAQLKDLIQVQEKLCWNYGRKRSSIAMGVYRSDLMSFPVHYRAADPDLTRFIPLDFERSLSLRQILSEHPKGLEFGSIVADSPRFPYLEDDRGETLSFPPIINSAHLGAVKVGDRQLFIELTGTDMDSLLLACSIVACDLADGGYAIKPVLVRYPYDTPCGRQVATPYYFQQPITLDVDYACKLLGEEIAPEEAAGFIRKMGCEVDRRGKKLAVAPPPYRNDFLHQVDAVEEVMIGAGMERFEPIWPEEFTVGRISRQEEFNRRVREIMVGLGYQEMIYTYLGSRRDLIERMNIGGEEVIEIANPMSESFEAVRNSILPCLLSSEAVSANAVYPHLIFEVGKTAVKDEGENYGSKTFDTLSFLYSDREAGFNQIHSHLSALFFYLSRDYSIRETQDPRFVPGRTGAVYVQSRKVGIIGEIHPAVLENWGIQMPCVGAEILLDRIIDGES